MRIAALVFLGIAGALSLALMPDWDALLPVFMFSVPRLCALMVALVLQVGRGGLDSWFRSKHAYMARGILAFLLMLGALLVLFVCGALQSVRYDELPDPYPALYLTLVRVLPLLVMAGAFWPSRVLFILGVAGALATGVFASLTWDTLHDQYRAEAPLRSQQVLDARAREIAPVMTALARVPPEAGVAPLLDFALLDQPHEAHEEAMRRIEAMPDAYERFSELFDGERALDALLVLASTAADRPHAIPEAIEDRAWIAAARIAGNLAGRMDMNPVPTEDMEKLCASVDILVHEGGSPWTLPRRRPAELTTVRDWMKAASAKEAGMDLRAVGSVPCFVRDHAIFLMDQALTPPAR